MTTSQTDWRDRISIDPAIHHGEPCIKGTRVPVRVIVGSVAAGDTAERIIAAWPQLSADDIKAARSFAAEMAGDVNLTPGDGLHRAGKRE